MKRTWIGTNPDGSPRFHYEQEDADKVVVYTGPIYGPVVLADGTTYDVSDDYIEVDPDHAAAVADVIGRRHAAEGHPTDDSFTYTPTEN